jgi:hypothetical protein
MVDAEVVDAEGKCGLFLAVAPESMGEAHWFVS